MLITGNLEEVSLYFHFPFCHRKCPYCHFYVLTERKNLKELFLKGLEKEWELKKDLLLGKTIASIYFGGGTPSRLSINELKTIISWIDSANLKKSDRFEFTLEANPEDLTLEYIKELSLLNINRLSIGVQSFDDELLKKLDRTHDSKKAIEAILLASSNGIKNISIDLMYDIPYQTLNSFTSSLQIVENLPITHLSLYNLTFEENTLFFRQKEKLKPHLPSEKTSLNMLLKAVTLLEKMNLKRYEISAFAKEGKLSYHNMGYWQGRTFFGFGPSAFSYHQGVRFKNISNLQQYYKLCMETKDPLDFQEKLEPENRQKELFAVQLRILSGICKKSFEEKNSPLFPSLTQSLKELQTDGLINFIDGKYQLSEKGLLFYDTVAERII